MARPRKQKGRQPVVCPECKQRGDERPGFKVNDYPEAVGFADDGGMTPVDSFTCNGCGFTFVVPKGTVEVRRP